MNAVGLDYPALSHRRETLKCSKQTSPFLPYISGDYGDVGIKIRFL